MQSIFVTGTDTDVGKTVIAACIARAAVESGIDVGVMKPFAAYDAAFSSEYNSSDAEILARAARCTDSDSEINPVFSEIPASPYTSSQKSGKAADVLAILHAYWDLAAAHKVMVVEGIGGIMTPILRDYFVADLAKDMNLPVLITVRNRIGALNHSILAHMACESRGVKAVGFVINCIDGTGYEPKLLADDLIKVTDLPVLGIVSQMDDAVCDASLYKMAKMLNLEML